MRISGVRVNAERQLALYKQSGRWLHDSISFDASLFLDNESKLIADKLYCSLISKPGDKKQQQKKKDFEILIANLLDQIRKPVSVSKNRNNWKTTKYNPISYFIIDLIDILKTNELIDMKTGNNVDKQHTLKTRIWATDKLLKEFPEYHSCVRYKPVQLVEVRDENKRLIDYPETEKVRKIRRILEKVNKINNEANIIHVFENKCLRLNTSVVAIFKNKLTLGGRLYSRGISGFQALSSEERQDITINNNRTVERDFKALHPFLLYAAEGKQIYQDPYLTVESNPVARPFMKQILLCMLNAKDETSAERAANNWLYENHSEREKLKEIGITRARPMIKKFLEVHQPIKHYFFKGKENGQRIINKDSKIALDVLNHFAKQNIPVLCIHDSFIVEEQHAEELVQVMKSTYRKHTGKRCIVK